MSTLAVLDAALAYGASRWYRNVHEDKSWEHRDKYRPIDDKLLFYEFLHDIPLYDHIILDRSSVGETVSNEILELFTKINVRTRRTVIDTGIIAPIKSLGPVVESVARLLADIDRDSETQNVLRRIPIPWAYSSQTHNDRAAFITAFEEAGVDLSLLPLGIFLYRGICYAGYANNYCMTESEPAVYLASPGRMKALAPILSSSEMKKLNYPKQAYADLVELLRLPTNGYAFSQMPSLPFHYHSALAQHIYEKSPREALDYVLKIRESTDAQKLREEWSARIWQSSRSVAVGSTYVQTATGVTVGGDLTMVIHAAAEV
jgi:hypothetical protein